MAGIGFEIRKILKRKSFLSLLQAYGYAGIISSGPWVLSILSVLLIGILAQVVSNKDQSVMQFLVAVTYLMAASLILTGAIQLLFTRFVADQIYANREDRVIPNLHGAILLTTLVSAGLGGLLATFVFDESFAIEAALLVNFIVLSDLWIVMIFLSSMKVYNQILLLFFIGYGLAVLTAVPLSVFGVPGMLIGMLIGHSFLFFSFFYLVLRNYPGESFLRFDFLKRDKVVLRLAATGFFFNFAVWIDKLQFWYTDHTSVAVLGPMRASVIYDLPIFLAYLSIIPGMAVFLVRMEADFAEKYHQFYDAIRSGDTLQHIRLFKGQMVYTARQGIYEVLKVQGITVAVLLLWGHDLLAFIGISTLYTPLFAIDVVAVSMQVLLLSILNVLFYLDSRNSALGICVIYWLLNGLLTGISIKMGASFYGYGFALANTLSIIVGLYLLNRKFNRLEFETFMLR